MWGIPDYDLLMLENISTPWKNPESFSVGSCILYARSLTRQVGYGFEQWDVVPNIPEDVRLEVGMSDAEIEMVKVPILKLVDDVSADVAA